MRAAFSLATCKIENGHVDLPERASALAEQQVSLASFDIELDARRFPVEEAKQREERQQQSRRWHSCLAFRADRSAGSEADSEAAELDGDFDTATSSTRDAGVQCEALQPTSATPPLYRLPSPAR